MVAGCGATGPAYDPGPRPDVGGSISGRVSASDGATALSGRKVTAINVATGTRYDVSTSTTGGYTVRVPVGVESIARVKFAGRSRLNIRYEYDTINGQPVRAATLPSPVTPLHARR